MIIDLGVLFDDNFSVPPLNQHMMVNKRILGIYSGVFNNEYPDFMAIIIFVLVWHFILKSLFPNFGVKFTMLKLVVIGLGLYTFDSLGFSQFISLSDILTINTMYTHQSSAIPVITCMDLNYFWTTIPVVFSQAGCAFAEIGLKSLSLRNFLIN